MIKVLLKNLAKLSEVIGNKVESSQPTVICNALMKTQNNEKDKKDTEKPHEALVRDPEWIESLNTVMDDNKPHGNMCVKVDV